MTKTITISSEGVFEVSSDVFVFLSATGHSNMQVDKWGD